VGQVLNEEIPIYEVCVQAIVELQEDVSLIVAHDRVFVDGLKELVLLNIAFLISECLKDTGMLYLLELDLIVELIHNQVDLIKELVRHPASSLTDLVLLPFGDEHGFKCLVIDELFKELELSLVNKDIQMVLILKQGFECFLDDIIILSVMLMDCPD
jgi:hypothetical protein